MSTSNKVTPEPTFSILAAGALYAGLERGLAADILAARAQGCVAQTVCTAIVAAGKGYVTDVVEVPADTIDAQLEQVFKTHTIHAAKVGIVGSADGAAILFKKLEQYLQGVFVLDVTISGPSGEDIADGRVRDVLTNNLGQPDIVSIRKTDAELLTAMEIKSLDDAQVAVQRMYKLGARRILLRGGRLPARFFEVENGASNLSVDLYYDGEEFAVYEAPLIQAPPFSGASSALLMSITKNLLLKRIPVEAIQAGKAYVSESIRRSNFTVDIDSINFFWKQSSSIRNY